MKHIHKHNQGFTLIEVLIALVLISIALLGLAGVQTRSLQSEIETYQRAQAMLLLEDISARIQVNRPARGCYQTVAGGSAYSLGTDTDAVPACLDFGNATTRTRADSDLASWDNLLDGASEGLGGNEVGGLTGARGCISYDAAGDRITVTVAWQGELITAAPNNACGQGAYGDDRLRRSLSETINFADLS